MLKIKGVSIVFVFLLQPLKYVLYKPRFPYFSGRNKRQITSVLQMRNHFLRLFCTVAKIGRSFVTLVDKGVFEWFFLSFLPFAHFTFGVTLLA